MDCGIIGYGATGRTHTQVIESLPDARGTKPVNPPFLHITIL